MVKIATPKAFGTSRSHNFERNRSICTENVIPNPRILYGLEVEIYLQDLLCTSVEVTISRFLVNKLQEV